jgi:parvulin-like peptidyl-prolyl isomerase
VHLSRLLFGVLAFTLAACSPGADVAARVGDVEITHAEVRARADLFRFLGGLNQQPCGTPVEGETAGAACARFALGNLVQSELIDGYARENGIELDPQAVDEAIAGLDQSQLEAAGLTRADVEDLASDALVGQEVADAVTEERVGEGALRSEYESRPLEFTNIEVQHILVGSEAEATDAYERVTARGATEETFAEVAREVSTDAGSAQGGGGYPARPASEYDPVFSEAALALDPGEISPPVETQFGWHVIRLVGEQPIAFSEAREQILQELVGAEFQDWFRERAGVLEVEVNPRYGRFDLRSLQVEAVRSTDPSTTGTGATGAIQPP